jgi:hypothetical protein
MSNLIARAEKEVILATNFWAAGPTTTLITNALKELSKRCGERNEKAVVKIMYDRGNPKQMVDNHQIVPPKEYTGKAIQIPAPEEIPNVHLQVMNYHRPMLGTFHSKFMVVDRKVACACSCNIQETDNVEMMCHLEGPIVDSFYDMALFSWSKAFDPPLPTASSPAALGGWRSFEADRYWRKESDAQTTTSPYTDAKFAPKHGPDDQKHVTFRNGANTGANTQDQSTSATGQAQTAGGNIAGVEGTEGLRVYFLSALCFKTV